VHVDLIFNPAAAAGRSAMHLGQALATFRKLGAAVQLHRPESSAAARQSMASLATTSERLVVLGGDGIVHMAANALAGSQTVLGIIAAGTGNDAATSLGLRADVESACRNALRDPMAIDLIDMGGGQVSVTVATAGFSVAVNERADQMNRISGSAKYTVASLAELPKLGTHSLALTLDGTMHEIEANLIAVANARYFGGGMKIAPDANMADGMLDVIVIGPASRMTFAAVLPTVFSGRHVNSKFVTTYRASVIELGGQDVALRADGEDCGRLPARLTVRPEALLVAGATV